MEKITLEVIHIDGPNADFLLEQASLALEVPASYVHPQTVGVFVVKRIVSTPDSGGNAPAAWITEVQCHPLAVSHALAKVWRKNTKTLVKVLGLFMRPLEADKLHRYLFGIDIPEDGQE